MSVTSTSSTGDQEDSVEGALTTFIRGWNDHDASRLAAAFSEECTFVDVLGRRFTSRDEVERTHAEAFATFLSKSRMRIVETRTTQLSPEMAVVHQAWRTTAQKLPGGEFEIPDRGFWTATAKRNPHGWQIVAFQNTSTIPFSDPKVQNPLS